MATSTEHRALEDIHTAMERVKEYVIDRGGNHESPLYVLADQMQVEAENMIRLLEQER